VYTSFLLEIRVYLFSPLSPGGRGVGGEGVNNSQGKEE